MVNFADNYNLALTNLEKMKTDYGFREFLSNLADQEHIRRSDILHYMSVYDRLKMT